MGLDELSMWFDDIGFNRLAEIAAAVYMALPDDITLAWIGAGLAVGMIVAAWLEARGRVVG